MSNFRSTLRSGPTTQLITTRAAPSGEEIEYWRDEVFGKLRLAKFDALDQRPFHGEFAMATVGELLLSNLQASPQVTERRAADIRSDSSASSVLCLVMSGSVEITSGAQHARLGTGTGILINVDVPGMLVNREALGLLMLHLPHTMINGGAAALERMNGRDLKQSSMLFPLVREYGMQLAAGGSRLDTATARRVGANLADLVNTMVAEVVQQSPLRLSEHKTAALMRVRMFVEEHLVNPELDALMVSQALRLSPRYINQLLEGEGTSLGRLIWRRRLERIEADLRNPALGMRTISTIALACGFNHASHFSKLFRKRYAMSPREYRAFVGTGGVRGE